MTVLTTPVRMMWAGLRLGLTSTDWLLRAIVVATIGLLVLASTTLWVSSQGREGIAAQQRSDEITACRSELRSDLDIARAAVDDVILDGLSAAATGDMDLLRSVVSDAGPARSARDRAVEAYRAGVTLSRDDPTLFLARCRAR